MEFDPSALAPGEVYSLLIRAIVPRPIAWISTTSSAGVHNLAPFSYFSGVCSAPAALAFSAVNRPDGSKKDTVNNIEATRQFVVNLVPHELVEPMHQTSADYAEEISEFEQVGLTPQQSQVVKPPRVAESPVNFECELMQVHLVGEGPLAANLIIGKILKIHVADRVLNDQHKIDPDQLDLVGRMGGSEYVRTLERFGIPPAKVNKPVDD